MTELDFLIELLLNHKLPKTTQKSIKERISVVQVQSGTGYAPPPARIRSPVPAGPPQAASMQKAVAELQMESGQHPTVAAQPLVPPQTPTTGAAQVALIERQKLINEALSEAGGNFKPGQRAPRKF